MIQRITDIKTDATAAFEKESKRLIVRLDDDSLTIALSDKTSNEWTAVEVFKIDKAGWEQEDVLQEIKQNSTLVSYTGLETKIFIETIEAIPFPTPLVNTAPLFIETHFGKTSSTEIITEEINDEISVAFVLPAISGKVLKQLFPQAQWFNTLALLIRKSIGPKNSNAASTIHLNIDSKLAEIVIVKEGKLLLARSFSYHAAEDILYHLLNACQLLDVNPYETAVKVAGKIKADSREMTLLSTYYSDVSFVTSLVSSHPAFQQLPAHYFTGLMQSV